MKNIDNRMPSMLDSSPVILTVRNTAGTIKTKAHFIEQFRLVFNRVTPLIHHHCLISLAMRQKCIL